MLIVLVATLLVVSVAGINVALILLARTHAHLTSLGRRCPTWA